MRSFASDNYAGVHPDVLAAIGAVNQDHQTAYGDDTTTAAFQARVRDLFGEHTAAHPVFNGTGANVVSLQAAARRWEAVICAETAHINSDEGGAPEKMAGLKLWTVPTTDGKLTPALIESQLFDIGSVHRAQPAVLSITNTTELGTVYTAAEIRAIAGLAHANNLYLHLDGARLANAAAALGSSFRDFTTDAGVDLVSLGGTKIGALAAEAVLILRTDEPRNAALAASVPFLRKSSMQLPSKMRFVSAQLLALLTDDLAVRNARHANAMAAKLDAGIRALGYQVPNPTQANAVFPILTADQTATLQQVFKFYVWDHRTGQVRLMCSWDTTDADIDAFLTEAARVR